MLKNIDYDDICYMEKAEGITAKPMNFLLYTKIEKIPFLQDRIIPVTGINLKKHSYDTSCFK